MDLVGYTFLLILLLRIAGADEEEPEDLLKTICGRPAVLTSIASGWDANVGQWPWQVSIRQDLVHVCAGTLISQQWVLTVASCFKSQDIKKYQVLVGSLHVFGLLDPKMIIPVSRIISHPDIQGNTSNAIAVVELAYPVSINPVILPICLPSSAEQLKNITSCWVTGWSYSDTHKYVNSYKMKEVKVSLIDLQTCNDYYQIESLSHAVKPTISEDTICSKLPVGQTDQCIGNRGDPLMCEVKDFWVLAGVLSWGSNCMRTNEPEVYKNISFYKSWIDKSTISLTEFSASSLDLSGPLPFMLLSLIFLGPP